MSYSIKQNYAQLGRAILTLVFMGTLFIGSSTANAASITGSMALGGEYSIPVGSDLLSTETITLLTVAAKADGWGDLSSVLENQTGLMHNNTLTIRPLFSAQDNVFEIGGFHFDIDSLTFVNETVIFLGMNGSGTLWGNGYDPTAATFDFSAQKFGGTYSLTLTAVPVPAAVWLFGSGLLGLIGIARRKTL